jgi:hypothetical protein
MTAVCRRLFKFHLSHLKLLYEPFVVNPFIPAYLPINYKKGKKKSYTAKLSLSGEL